MIFVIDLELDGYETKEEMENACRLFILEQLDFSGSSVKIIDFSGSSVKIIDSREEV